MDRYEKISAGINDCFRILESVGWTSEGTPDWYHRVMCRKDDDVKSKERLSALAEFNDRYDKLLSDMLEDFPITILDHVFLREEVASIFDSTLRPRIDARRVDQLRKATRLKPTLPLLVVYITVAHYRWPLNMLRLTKVDDFRSRYREWIMRPVDRPSMA